MTTRSRVGIWRFGLGVWLVALTGAGGALAAESAPCKTSSTPRSNLALLHENDFFNHTDRQYTSGTRISLVEAGYDAAAQDNCRSAQQRARATTVNAWMSAELRQRLFEISLGQQLFTPTERRSTEVIRNDRPYAGWLFGRWALHGFAPDRSQTIALDIGMVGPAAAGSASQNFFHAIEGYERFEGWRNQLRNELGVQVTAETRQLFWRGSGSALVAHYGGALGNVETYLNAGLHAQLGANTVDGMRMPASFRAGSAAMQPATASKSNDSLQTLAGFDLRAVAHNIFLDGNTWKQSHSVERKVLVADVYLGFSWRWAGLDLSYTHTVRSREFRGQPVVSIFGGLSLSIPWN